MKAALAHWIERLGRHDGRADVLRMWVQATGPVGNLGVPSGADGVWEVGTAGDRPCLRPVPSSSYLYFVLPSRFRRAGARELWVEVEYFGPHYAEFRLQYASRSRAQTRDGLYEVAEQRWQPDGAGPRRFRRAVFRLPDFDPEGTQNLGASFRLEFRRDLVVSQVEVRRSSPDPEAFPAVAPLADLRKLPGRFYPIDYLFLEITNACNFKCTWCPDQRMARQRGFMDKTRVFRILDEVAQKRSWLGPIFPVKLHQMGEPMLHPDLAEIVSYAESRSVPIELNTNCGLITADRVDALYRAGLTNLILSFQTPDPAAFKTRRVPRLSFEEYRDRVRLAVERKVALEARTRIEIDLLNTKHSQGQRVVSEDEQALALLAEWIGFCQELERRYGLPPRPHDWERLRVTRFLDQDENAGRHELLEGVHLLWKRCHNWGHALEVGQDPLVARPSSGQPDTYCPAPHDQLVVQWNGDVVSCCTDYEGETRTTNVFSGSLEEAWRHDVRRDRLRDMLEGRLLDVCARCQGLTHA